MTPRHRKSPSKERLWEIGLPAVLPLMRRYNNKPDALTYPNTCARNRPRDRGEREIEKLAITNGELARATEEDGRIYGFKAADVFSIRRTDIAFLHLFCFITDHIKNAAFHDLCTIRPLFVLIFLWFNRDVHVERNEWKFKWPSSVRSASNCIFRHGRATAPCSGMPSITLPPSLESTDQYFSHMPDFASRPTWLDRTNLNFDSTRPVSPSVAPSDGRIVTACVKSPLARCGSL